MFDVQSGVDERDPPVVDVGAQQLDVPPAVGQHEVVVDAFVVVEEVLLDLRRTVAEAEDELVVPEMGVVPHQVPQDGTLPDLDERLRYLVGVVAQAHSLTAAEQHDLQLLVRSARLAPKTNSPEPSDPSSKRCTMASGIGAKSDARMKSRIDEPLQFASTLRADRRSAMSPTWTVRKSIE